MVLLFRRRAAASRRTGSGAFFSKGKKILIKYKLYSDSIEKTSLTLKEAKQEKISSFLKQEEAELKKIEKELKEIGGYLNSAETFLTRSYVPNFKGKENAFTKVLLLKEKLQNVKSQLDLLKKGKSLSKASDMQEAQEFAGLIALYVDKLKQARLPLVVELALKPVLNTADRKVEAVKKTAGEIYILHEMFKVVQQAGSFKKIEKINKEQFQEKARTDLEKQIKKIIKNKK